MIRTFRAFFLSRALREKLILLAFLGFAVVLWASAYSSRSTRFWKAQQSTTLALKDQDTWLARRDQIEAFTKQEASRMDATKTLDPTNLSVVITQLATEASVKLRSLGASASPFNSGQFSINSQRFQIDPSDWHAFATFYQHLQERAPYVAITELALQPVRGNPAQVTASLTVASFEIRH